MAALGAIEVGLEMPAMDQEVADVGNPGKGVGESEDRVAPVEDGVAEEEERSGQTEPPEGNRHNHLFPLLGGVPLYDESGEEHAVTNPANEFPGVPFNAEEDSVGEHRAGGKPVHGGIKPGAVASDKSKGAPRFTGVAGRGRMS